MAIAAADARRIGGKPSSFRISQFPVPLSERELSRLWQDQTFPAEALITTAGERLRVIYRGRRGGGAGPDFRDALVASPRGLLRGDVELHVRSGDFRRHGHERDAAYAGVVLHVVFEDDEGGPTALPGGGLAPVVALAGWARSRATEIARWLERPALWREPCFSALKRDGGAQVAATLDRLGDMRFRQKTAALALRLRERGKGKWEMGRMVAEAAEILWEALLEALAFGPDREAFRLLARRLAWTRLRPRLVSLPAGERAVEARRLLGEAFSGAGVSRPVARRPADRPERRLEGAARLAARFAEKGLLEPFCEALKRETQSAAIKSAARAKTETAKTASVTSHGSAGFRISGFESRPGERSPDEAKREGGKIVSATSQGSAGHPFSSFEFRPAQQARSQSRMVASLIGLLTVPGLIGRGRAVEIAANAVLPCLAALGPESRARRAEAAYAALPLPARYGAVRHLHEAVGGEVRIDFRRQQGMLYLLKQYCTQGGCGRCPLS